jgi:hypothetical protein
MTTHTRTVELYAALCDYIEHTLAPDLPDTVRATSPQACRIASAVMETLDARIDEFMAVCPCALCTERHSATEAA